MLLTDVSSFPLLCIYCELNIPPLAEYQRHPLSASFCLSFCNLGMEVIRKVNFVFYHTLARGTARVF